ncbi:ATP-dependent helicase HrpB [Roseiconus nitratireducens]|uniref:ATP-dependent helicase HrpB n=1 Tax=Roseiconus nitratireducens TaxID=2605748 RepID=A0A5M6DLL3_9BACT|nr:ATP-dependent helicase HrpB [Roseiconus nitratireducens]KAA5547020.1 ATP-dependent helicase HrpB [Roseiconus nitratireducens]
MLPIDACLPDVVRAIAAGKPVILQAPPGAGKTTGVPPALLQSSTLPPGQILLLQPRRLAARAAARRLAAMVDQPVGQTYGYHVRFDRQVRRDTSVIAMTTGILLQRLNADPLLEDVACVIVDEFHERSLDVDLALGMLQRIRTSLRPELRLVVMSATLETEPVARLLKDAVTVKSEGRAFDVQIHYQDSVRREPVEDQVADVLPEALRESDGDVLVFLPGVGEIHRTAAQIQRRSEFAALHVCKLYGDLTPGDQDAVLSPSDRRKVVLSTNVAETSVTIEGITAVIDSGLARVMQFNAAVGIPGLQLQPISKASADQRAGRAGRTAPGICFRLWPAAMHRSRPDHTSPEVLRSDLCGAVLTLAAWGERDVFEFPWVTAPAEAAVRRSRHLLERFGAVDRSGSITTLGRAMVSLPVHPRLARLLVAASQYDCLQAACLAAALLSERDPFLTRSSLELQSGKRSIESDLLERVQRLQRFLDGGNDPMLHGIAAKNIGKVAKHLSRAITDQPASPTGDSPLSPDERFSRALLAAYPDRLARRREPGSPKGIMVGGKGVTLDRQSTVHHSPLFLCVDVDDRSEETLVRIASEVDETWLPSEWLQRKRQLRFDPTLQAVVAREQLRFDDLVLRESPAECTPDDETAQLLFDSAADRLDRILDAQGKTTQSFLTRWRFLSEHLQLSDDEGSGAAIPPFDPMRLHEQLRMFCRDRTSIKQLMDAPWLDHLRGGFTYEQLQFLDRQAPETLEVPSGNRIRVEYAPGAPPRLSVRIQELYGWQTAPRLAGGKIPLQLQLLGPNHRPQQVTDDLQSFWENTYPAVRKELKRRYAKHHWPDAPANATPTRNGLKPRS